MGNIEEYNKLKASNYGDVLGFSMEFYDENVKNKILSTLMRETGKTAEELTLECKKGMHGDFYKRIFKNGYNTTLSVYNQDCLKSFYELNNTGFVTPERDIQNLCEMDGQHIEFSDYIRELRYYGMENVDQFNYFEEDELNKSVIKFMKKNCVSGIKWCVDKTGDSYIALSTNNYKMKDSGPRKKNRLSALNGMTFHSVDDLIEFISSYSPRVNVGL